MKKQAWTAILLWMALFSFTLSAQGTGGTTTDLTVTTEVNGTTQTETIRESYKIESSGTYHFTGTYSGNPTAEIKKSESEVVGTAVISVEEGAGEVIIILDGVNITLTGNQQCPLSARNATGTVIVQLKGTNTLASTYSGGGGQCPALWAPQTTEGKLIINSLGTGSEVGSLTAKGAQDAPGIGSMSREGSQITINSGTIKAIGGANAAGIGGGPFATGGEITISGANTNVTANGGNWGAGIGGGHLGAGGTITISGGTVTANGGNWGAGIGGGDYGNGGTITISGANTNVTATGSDGGAGIGGGYGGAGGTIKITGGTVEATGSTNSPKDGSAGIGGGYYGNGGTITIEGGKVQATGGYWGAGIGGGYGGAGGKIILSGGEVTAKGGNWGACIGDGYDGNGGTITITGGEVTAINGSNTTPGPPDIKGNTVIVGPDATVKKDESGTNAVQYNGYTNGFVFSNNAAEVTMQGTATLLANMTIGTNQTLIIPTDASLTIEEKVTLENKGTITNKGTIKNAGTIKGNAPVGGNLLTKLTKEMITVAPCTYTGNALTPGVTVKSSSTTYEKDTDYTLTCANNTNAAEPTAANPPTVKVLPKEGGKLYGDPVSKTFTIEKATPNATDFTFSQPTDLTYDGQAKTATVQANSNINGMGTVTIKYYGADNNECEPINAGTYTVKISVTEGTNFKASTDLTADDWKFTINKATPSTPTSLTATYGETLDNVTLPDGWTWRDATTTSVGDVGTNKFTAKLDTDNYEYDGESTVEVSITVTPANATLSFAQPTLTMTQGNAVPTNALTKPEDCTVNYTSSEPTVATVDAATGTVTVVGVGTTTIKATAGGNYTGTATYTLTVNRYIPPYIPPTPDPDPDPVYYTVTIPSEVAGAIIHGGGTHEVEEYTYCSFRIELDPNGNGEYPTVTKGYWWDTLTPDGQGNYSVYVTGNTQITIGEVPTNSYDYYQVTLPTDSVAEADDQYWSGDYIEVTGASPLRAAEEASLSYQAPFGMTVSLRPIETERRKFLQWEDGSKQKERTLTLRADQEIKALWQRISPTGIEAIAAGSVLRGERGQLYIEVPEPCDVTLYTYGGVPVRVARLAAGANRLANLNAGLYLVKIGAAQAVPVRVR